MIERKIRANLRLIVELYSILHDNIEDSLYFVVEFEYRREQVEHCYYVLQLYPLKTKRLITIDYHTNSYLLCVNNESP